MTHLLTMDDSVLIGGHFQSVGLTRGSGGLIGVSLDQPARITWRSGLTYLPALGSVVLTEDRVILCGGFDSLLGSGQQSHTRQGLAALDRESREVLDLRVGLGDQESIHHDAREAPGFSRGEG
ncbi:hypothetical protein CKO35_10735 [Ectothiorhodospira shaposhnikovii]|uniref:hypothetical protein n=1 Tax=Ectothiorhodospira shaposhnikovii TaxID=1054 RepID=UPI0019059B51|nr:hypothetical protein [Ectothiorhodospira shaposhnikovii]MBK1673772.1 hypothetical protein [Ectothiorhodospira shaposhnikovii]